MQDAKKKPLRIVFFLALAAVAVYILAFKTNILRQPKTVTQAEWQPVQGVALSSGLVGVAFTNAGDAGAILANNGQVILSQDGGIHWRQASTPLDDAEIHFAPCLAMPSAERVLFGTTVDDDSPYGAVYEVSPTGRKRILWSGENGGLLGASQDGGFFVGNNGLLLKLEDENSQAVQAPACGQVVLYGVSQKQERVIAVGRNGIVLISEDGGRTWVCKQLDFAPELHRVAQSENAALVAGDNGAIYWYEPGTQAWSKATGTQSWMSVWALLLAGDGSEAYAAGGDVEGNRPFILHSTDGGRKWTFEPVRGAGSRIMGIGQGRAGLFAVTFDGHVLVRGQAGQ